jgi:hypothetical protein
MASSYGLAALDGRRSVLTVRDIDGPGGGIGGGGA